MHLTEIGLCTPFDNEIRSSVAFCAKQGGDVDRQIDNRYCHPARPTISQSSHYRIELNAIFHS
jgi:hypothetical protein